MVTLRERIEQWHKLYDAWYEYDKAGKLLEKAANLIEELEQELDVAKIEIKELKERFEDMILEGKEERD